ncbi:MAG: glycosyltransferase family 4 protein [Fimbriimonas sp.]
MVREPKHHRIMYVLNTDWFFASHRISLARSAYSNGFEVYVAAPDTGFSGEIAANGFTFVNLQMDRAKLNATADIRLCLDLLKLYRRVRPAVVHHSTAKPIIFGSIVAKFVPGTKVVNLVSGFGTGMSSKTGLRSRLMRIMWRWALKGPNKVAVFQNPEDMEYSIEEGFIDRSNTVLIRGSGVDPQRFTYQPEPTGVPIVLFASRLLIDKGVPEFVEAAKAMKAAGMQARFVLAGAPDEGNPGTVTEAQLKEWQDSGAVEWWGHQSNMQEVLAQSAIMVLPSRYKEGLPKVLIEAASVGRPIVTTDIPGCREIVQDGKNGYLIQIGDQQALNDSILKLLKDPELRTRFGKAGRQLVLDEFAESIVVEKNQELLRALVPTMIHLETPNVGEEPEEPLLAARPL